MRSYPRALRRFLLLPLAALAATACTPAETTLPDGFLGRWDYLGSSGGIAGDGLGDEATGYIVITPRTIEHFADDGTPIGVTSFTVSRGRTIFGEDEMWLLTSRDGLDEAILPSATGDTISLVENVYDGIGRSYERVR